MADMISLILNSVLGMYVVCFSSYVLLFLYLQAWTDGKGHMFQHSYMENNKQC